MHQREMHGKEALITGPTAGIGEELAKELAFRGCTVVLVARNPKRAQDTRNRILQADYKADVEIAPSVDMANPDSIKSFTQQWIDSCRPIHILVLNAGVSTFPRRYNERGIPYLCQVNYLGAYYLTRLLEGVLVDHKARVVHVSSMLHRMGTLGDDVKTDFLLGDFGHSYPNTKLANCLFGYELQRRLGSFGVQSVVVDPGAVNSNVWHEFPGLVKTLLGHIYAPTSEGARPLLLACYGSWSDPSLRAPLPPPPSSLQQRDTAVSPGVVERVKGVVGGVVHGVFSPFSWLSMLSSTLPSSITSTSTTTATTKRGTASSGTTTTSAVSPQHIPLLHHRRQGHNRQQQQQQQQTMLDYQLAAAAAATATDFPAGPSTATATSTQPELFHGKAPSNRPPPTTTIAPTSITSIWGSISTTGGTTSPPTINKNIATTTKNNNRHGQQQRGSSYQVPPEQDLRYLAPDAFASPLITWFSVPKSPQTAVSRFFMRAFTVPTSEPFLTNLIKQTTWVGLSILVSAVDWPVRRLTGGRFLGGVKSTRSSESSYDEEVAKELWDASAELCGLSKEVQIE